jgi:DinB superfamily
MNIQSALKSQYHAALKTLRLAVEKCPDELWDDPADGAAPFWRVVYHTLFFTNFYLQQDQSAFTPWAKHRAEVDFLGDDSGDNPRHPMPFSPYTRVELLEYWRVCDDMIDGGVNVLDLSALQCGFPWYNMPKLDHQILNIRHTQHHAAALATRLRRTAGIGVEWVGGDEARGSLCV